MGERDTVELRLRLPAGELGRLAQLMERTRELLAMEGGGNQSPTLSGSAEFSEEAGVSTAFDAVQFHHLAEAAGAEPRGEHEAANPPPESAGAEVEPEAAVPAEVSVQDGPEAASAEARVESDPDIPAVKAELSPGPETPTGSTEALRTVPETAAAAPAGNEPPSPPASAGSEMEETLEGAPGASFAVSGTLKGPEGGAFAAVEELASPGPAPLTAESVALAFQRDDRRYDNGFPLY